MNIYRVYNRTYSSYHANRAHAEAELACASATTGLMFESIYVGEAPIEKELAELKREKAMLKDQLKLAQQKCDDIKIELKEETVKSFVGLQYKEQLQTAELALEERDQQLAHSQAVSRKLASWVVEGKFGGELSKDDVLELAEQEETKKEN